VTIFDCYRSERELLKVKWAIDETKLSEENKVYWKDVVNKGIEICRKDRVINHRRILWISQK
jgi:hypothetical protein